MENPEFRKEVAGIFQESNFDKNMIKKLVCFLLGHNIIYKYLCNLGALFRGEQGETTAECGRCKKIIKI